MESKFELSYSSELDSPGLLRIPDSTSDLKSRQKWDSCVPQYSPLLPYFTYIHTLFQVTTDLHHKCTEEFKGTSSAAPLAAGMFALVLQAK